MHDGCGYREYSFRYSYTGREFTSIWGYLISNGIDEYWYTEDDILEMMPQVDLNEIEDATNSNQRQNVIDIFVNPLSVNFYFYFNTLTPQRFE